MDYRDLTTILIRLAGILMIVFAVLNIPIYFLQYYSLQVDSVATFIGIAAAPFLLTIAIGLLFFFIPSVVTNRAAPSTVASSGNSHNGLLIAGLAVLGAYLVIVGIADLVYLGSLYVVANEGFGNSFTPDRWADLLASVTEVVLGTVLVFRGKQIARLSLGAEGHGQ